MILFIFLMAIGFILVGKKLKGSCGGLGSIMGEDCMFCSKAEECKKMPPFGRGLSDFQISMVECWVENGMKN